MKEDALPQASDPPLKKCGERPHPEHATPPVGMCEEEEWLVNYYQKAHAEKVMDLDRRDTFTNWGLTIFLGVIALYAEMLGRTIESIWRFGLLLTAFGLFLRFYIHSCLTYAWTHKWNKLIIIEQYWISKKQDPTLEEVKEEIRKYDHDQKVPIRRLKILKAQLQTGYIIIFPVLAFLIFQESINIDLSGNYYNMALFLIFICYLVYEVYNFTSYSKIDMPRN